MYFYDFYTIATNDPTVLNVYIAFCNVSVCVGVLGVLGAFDEWKYFESFFPLFCNSFWPLLVYVHVKVPIPRIL